MRRSSRPQPKDLAAGPRTAKSIVACIAIGSLTAGSALAQTAPAPPPTSQMTMPVPAPVSDPGSMVVTLTPGTLPEGSAGPVINRTVSNPPIPDSIENRKLYGGPDSAGGRATAPHPGPVLKTPERAPKPKP